MMIWRYLIFYHGKHGKHGPDCYRDWPPDGGFCFLSLREKFEENYLFLHRILWHNKMEAKPKTKNFIVSLLECKRELRDCIQKGADPKEMKRIASKYGFKFATPV